MFGKKQKEIEDLTEKLGDEISVSNKRSAVARMFMLLAEGCQKHPSYRAVRKPKDGCEKCREQFNARRLVNGSECAREMGYVVRSGKRGKAAE